MSHGVYQRLMRTRYWTDLQVDEPEYPGFFSTIFPAEEPARRIVAVDWSTPGWVEVTWLIGAQASDQIPAPSEEKT